MRIGSIGKDFMDINREPAQGERSKPEREQKQPREKKAFHCIKLYEGAFSGD
jgi:hypothetical protein